MLAYLSLIINPNDDEAFKRIVNYPARGIGETTVARIEDIARAKNLSMWHAVSELVASTVHDSVEKVVVRKVADFVRLISELSAIRMQMSVCDFGKEVLARSGILHMLEAEKKPENDTSKDYLDQLLSMMSSYEEECAKDVDEGLRDAEFEPTIDEWMQNIMLQTDQDQNDDGNRVTLMTVHSAKGVEYDYVYIVGMEEGLFPSNRSIESLSDLEEERRLMYVAITRAKRAVMLSYAEMRRVWGKTENSSPSRFLKEIDSQYVEANFNINELSGRSRWERAIGEIGESSQPERPRQRYDMRRGEVPIRRSTPAAEPQRPRPDIIATPKPLDPSRSGMRSVGVRAADATAAVGDSQYSVGERVEHPKFGVGTIQRIDALATDHKLVVEFESYGLKTLLAKFAKLTKR